MKKYKMRFIKEKKGTEDFRLPQCSCGKLVNEYYEFDDSDPSEEVIIVDIVCEDCLKKWLRSR